MVVVRGHWYHISRQRDTGDHGRGQLGYQIGQKGEHGITEEIVRVGGGTQHPPTKNTQVENLRIKRV